MASKPFVYRGRDRTTEDVKRAATMSTGNYDSYLQDGFPVFKPKEGENVVRIMPPTWPEKDIPKWGKDWAIILSVHHNIGPDGGSFLCLDAMFDEPCPICEVRREETDDDVRYKLSAGKRALAWVIDRNDQGAGPMLWSMPIKKIFKVVNARSIDRKSGGLLLIDDPDEGYDVIFNADGAGKITVDYTGVDVDRDPTPLAAKPATQAKWLDFISENPLPTVLNVEDAAYIEKALHGKVSRKAAAADDEAEEVEGELPARRPRRAATEEPPFEEEDPSPRRTTRRPAEETEAEEEEAEAPPPRRARAEPEEEVEEEAEAEAPRRSGRRVALAGEAEDEPAPPPRRTARIPAEDDPPPRRTVRAAPADDTPAPSRAARAGLERLRPKR